MPVPIQTVLSTQLLALQVGKKLTNEMILAPSVKLPAPRVTMQSTPRPLHSSTILSTSSQGVCGRMPRRNPTTLSPRASRRSWKSCVLLMEFETIMYTFEAWNVSWTCFAQASGNGRPEDRYGFGSGGNAARKFSTDWVMIVSAALGSGKEGKVSGL